MSLRGAVLVWYLVLGGGSNSRVDKGSLTVGVRVMAEGRPG